ncbi:hypothetical protein PsYK624_165930 [Phanerochaete sordida]|uniref:Uncharacterized protein n=1 Tax=Phanerochaete sordida TaxID=48140 RepID=A0A9P3GR40_9APHY|nr:hypothetical protein PsYK624_165930 [Phanerochaete sordida]
MSAAMLPDQSNARRGIARRILTSGPKIRCISTRTSPAPALRSGKPQPPAAQRVHSNIATAQTVPVPVCSAFSGGKQHARRAPRSLTRRTRHARAIAVRARGRGARGGRRRAHVVRPRRNDRRRVCDIRGRGAFSTKSLDVGAAIACVDSWIPDSIYGAAARRVRENGSSVGPSGGVRPAIAACLRGTEAPQAGTN